jgi:hypothetical protein
MVEYPFGLVSEPALAIACFADIRPRACGAPRPRFVPERLTRSTASRQCRERR